MRTPLRSSAPARRAFGPSLTAVALCLAVPAAAQLAPASVVAQEAMLAASLSGPVHMEILAREVTSLEVTRQQQEGAGTAPILGDDKMARVRAASWSLLIPGWSQLRGGHTTRGFIFLGIETAVWTTYFVSQSQGHQRENAYQDYAVQFAQVQGTDRNDDYWRAVASYHTSDEYNEVVRRDLRSGITPDGGEYSGADAWRWQNERRFEGYQELRRSSNSAYDRATMVTMFALVNRAVAFIDALRDPVAQKTKVEAQVVGMDVKLSVKPSLREPGATLTLQRHF